MSWILTLCAGFQAANILEHFHRNEHVLYFDILSFFIALVGSLIMSVANL